MDITHGDELQCHVINIDLEKRVFYGHVDAEVIEGVIRRKSKKKKKIKEVSCFFQAFLLEKVTLLVIWQNIQRKQLLHISVLQTSVPLLLIQFISEFDFFRVRSLPDFT